MATRARITPSPMRPASRSIFGPLAATAMGGHWSGAANISLMSPDSSGTRCPPQSARISSTVCSSRARVAGRRPMVLTEVNPLPMPNVRRPRESSCSVAAALAVTAETRVMGLVTPVPRRILEVAWAAAPSSTYISRQMSWESPTQT